MHLCSVHTSKHDALLSFNYFNKIAGCMRDTRFFYATKLYWNTSVSILSIHIHIPPTLVLFVTFICLPFSLVTFILPFSSCIMLWQIKSKNWMEMECTLLCHYAFLFLRQMCVCAHVNVMWKWRQLKRKNKFPFDASCCT